MNLTTYIVGASLALTGIVYGYFTLKHRATTAQLEAATTLIDVQQAQLTAAKNVNDQNMAAIEAIKADLQRQAGIAAAAQAAERKRTAELNAAKRKIQDAPKTDDGPVAPVLRNALDGLQPPVGNPPPNSPDANPSGTTASEPLGPPLPGETPAT